MTQSDYRRRCQTCEAVFRSTAEVQCPMADRDGNRPPGCIRDFVPPMGPTMRFEVIRGDVTKGTR
jgi:hypothetical protein